MDALKKARQEGRKSSSKKSSIGVIHEEDEDDKYTSPKAQSKYSKRSSKAESTVTAEQSEKNSRNKGPVVTDGKGVYDSTDSAKKDNSSGYVMKTNLNLSGAGL
jgi:hypothetical protein